MSKWKLKEERPSIQLNGIRADAVTGMSLQTENDELSLWRCTQEREDVAEVVLALMANGRLSALEGIQIIIFEKGELMAGNLTVIDSPQNAQTLITNLSIRHMDAIQLHVENIIYLVKIIADKVHREMNCYLFTRKQVVEIMRNATMSGRLKLNDLTRLKPEQKAEIQ